MFKLLNRYLDIINPKFYSDKNLYGNISRIFLSDISVVDKLEGYHKIDFSVDMFDKDINDLKIMMNNIGSNSSLLFVNF